MNNENRLTNKEVSIAYSTFEVQTNYRPKWRKQIWNNFLTKSLIFKTVGFLQDAQLERTLSPIAIVRLDSYHKQTLGLLCWGW